MEGMLTSRILVNVTVVVEIPKTWDSRCTLGQIKKQASEEGERIVKKALTGKAHILSGSTIKVVIDEC